MGGKGGQGWEESEPHERKLCTPPSLCSSTFVAWTRCGSLRFRQIQSIPMSALWPFWTLAPKASPPPSPLLYHTPSLCLPLYPDFQGCCLQFTARAKLGLARQQLGRMGVGGQGDAPSFSWVFPSLSLAPLRLPSPPLGGPRPKHILQGTGSQAPRARWLNPRKRREGTLLSSEARSSWAPVARGQQPLFSRGLARLCCWCTARATQGHQECSLLPMACGRLQAPVLRGGGYRVRE